MREGDRLGLRDYETEGEGGRRGGRARVPDLLRIRAGRALGGLGGLVYMAVLGPAGNRACIRQDAGERERNREGGGPWDPRGGERYWSK